MDGIDTGSENRNPISSRPRAFRYIYWSKLIEKSFNRLEIGGTLMLVTKRRDWYLNKLKAIFGGAKIVEKDGYFVFSARKLRPVYANRLDK